MTDDPSALPGNEEASAELRALQQRAYGPDADILDNPEALRRLEELQSARPLPVSALDRAGASTEEVRSSPTEDDASQKAVLSAAPVGAEPAREPEGERGPHVDLRSADADQQIDADSGSTAPAAASRGRRRRMPLLWAGSIILTALLVAGVTALWISAQRPATAAVPAGAREVAVLSEQKGRTLSDVESTGIFGDPGARAYEDFDGIAVVEPSTDTFGPADEKCLYVFRASDYNGATQSLEGELYTGCGAGRFPATVQLPVTDRLPAEITKRFPKGSALQFVQDGDKVRVYSDR